ncbi:MAG: O-antigen ligase family protein, partial [Phycisphaerae bacterium]
MDLDKTVKTKSEWFEYLLLGICLCVLAIRATFPENINYTGANPWLNLNDDFISLSLSSILLGTVVLWWIYILFRRDSAYRLTGLEIGAMLFVIGGIIGTLAASNKRAAINDFITLIVPIITAMMFVQICNSNIKIRLVLAVLVGIAVASAFQCVSQYFVDTKLLIEQYEHEPQSILEPLGITRGTFEHMLFEHRIYTRGINGFLTTSNSVGSFALLSCFAAIALFAERIRNFIRERKSSLFLILTGIVLAVSLLNLVIPQSKGAIGSFILALLVFFLLIIFGRIIARRRKTVLLVCLIVAIAAGFLVVSYGMKHDTLPGGNSMLVRWQYWTASAQMYRDNSFAGVGPGNFNSYYPKYKIPAAPEVVRDPHNFLLAFLTQYGPIGLLGFLLILAAVWNRGLCVLGTCELKSSQQNSRKIFIIFAAVVTAAMLLVRPFVKPMVVSDEHTAIIFYAFFALYIVPAVSFLIGFWLACGAFKEKQLLVTDLTAAAIIAGTFGVIIHNTIDFAVFEPGIYTSFWFCMAIITAIYIINRNAGFKMFLLGISAKMILLFLHLIVFAFVFVLGFMPVAQSTHANRKAQISLMSGLMDNAQGFLNAAAKADPLNPVPYSVKGRLALQEYYFYNGASEEPLFMAEDS